MRSGSSSGVPGHTFSWTSLPETGPGIQTRPGLSGDNREKHRSMPWLKKSLHADFYNSLEQLLLAVQLCPQQIRQRKSLLFEEIMLYNIMMQYVRCMFVFANCTMVLVWCMFAHLSMQSFLPLNIIGSRKLVALTEKADAYNISKKVTLQLLRYIMVILLVITN